MNEFSAKKLGEVLAFSNVGIDTWSKGKEGLLKVFSEEEFTQILTKQEHLANSLKTIADQEGTSNITQTKAEATGGKLSKMRDMYVGDEWDNSAELMEWLGFFEGSAVVHWSLVEGVGMKLANTQIQELANLAMDFHQNLLTKVVEKIKQVGRERAE